MESSIPSILILESDSRQTELAMDLIREIVRARVDTTNTGGRAIELVARTPYQLIIADCAAGDLDGLSVLERVKRISPSTAVMLTSAYATIEEAVKAVRSGADEYFKKPYNPEQFKFAVRRCLDRRALFTGDESVSELMLLLNASQLISGYIEEDKILETAVGYLKRETSAKGVALFRLQGGVRSRVLTSLDADADVVEVIVEGHGFLQDAQEDAAPLRIFPRTPSSPETAVFRFHCVGEAEYFAVCIAPHWTRSMDEAMSRFRMLQAQIQMTGRNIQNYIGVRHLLYLDEPTGLYNTRYLHRHLDELFARRAKSGGPVFSVLFLDVDRFKMINDRHGHLVGTKLLQEMGLIVRKCLRRHDHAFRYGGDEFVIVLEGVGTQVACAVAEKIRGLVDGHRFLSRESLNIHLTVSIGVATCPDHATAKREILDAADVAMYAVKRSTRNKVYLAERRAA